MRSSIRRVIPLFLVLSATAVAQTRPATQPPQFKGIFEPVSYTEDLGLNDVFFVNGDVGWVAGDFGTILHTTDGGKKWTAQLGGDPANKAEDIKLIRFVDERRGWAVQGKKILHTRDGESWEEIGTLPYGVLDMAFTSPTVGFVAAKATEYSGDADAVWRSTDGGRTWKMVWQCSAKVQIGGLSRNLACNVLQLQFVTPTVAYAALRNKCTGMGCEPPPLIAKSTDGGESWQASAGPGITDQDRVTSVFFIDERTGFVRLASKKLHMTTDGGETWKGIVASPGPDIKFADPGVGWGLELDRTDPRMSFTTDGGARWSAREFRMPTTANAYSFPRRDRAYIVGEHGMVFRYRVVPASQAAVANEIAAPVMPAFDSPLDEQVQQLEQVVAELTTSVGGEAGAGAGGGAGAGAGTAVETTSAGSPASSGDVPLAPASAFTNQCCKKSFNKLEVILGALSQTLPDFIGKYRNLNLLLAAVRMGGELPGQYRSVREGLNGFRKADSKESAASALAGVSAALKAFKQTTDVSMQKQLPPVQP